MLTALEDKVKERDSLWEDLGVSLELNRLYGTKDEALTAGAYQISNGVSVPTAVFITIQDKEVGEVKVFRATRVEFRKSKLSKMKVQTRRNHPYLEGRQAKDLVDG